MIEDEDELKMWERYETARKDLIVFYLPVVDRLAKAIARSMRRVNWEDLRQDGAIGLIKAITNFHFDRGVPFRAYATKYIRGAIFDSPELTRDMSRQDEAIYRKVRRAEDSLTKTLGRNPTPEEIAEKTKLTIEQIRNAFAARGLANPEEFTDDQDFRSSGGGTDSSRRDSRILLEEVLAHLPEPDKTIIRLHYFEDLSPEKIAEKLLIIPTEVTLIRRRAIDKVAKICQRAPHKLRKRFNVK